MYFNKLLSNQEKGKIKKQLDREESSRPGEFHPKPLTEPYLKVSPHTALHIHATISG